MPTSSPTQCGYVAIVGRPNVGKSTLLNALLDQKLSITSRKPQTTRHQLLGIKSGTEHQILYVDTPGIHAAGKRAINRYMNRNAFSVISDVDVIVFLVDRQHWTEDDEMVLEAIQKASVKVIVAVNKVDMVKDKRQLLPLLSTLQSKVPEAEIMPISAEKGDNLKMLEQEVVKALPNGPFYFEADQVTDRSERFMASEVIREKLMRQLGDELPYAVTIQIDEFRETGTIIHIGATIFVEREGQKTILIGKSGQRLKQIGIDARRDLETMMSKKIMLNTWVKVKSGWSDSERALKSLGYDDI
ncbi:MAG: GTPase Era [Gammaproteobacteria bacterium]|jgi:GTP-binding protein Era|nr:GTPase Era [Gammaproteobacteria bacterium]|tara:strand:- start:1227 stop:2129 length:903 start_codon:yes stop_codon:yes gene_type:complete